MHAGNLYRQNGSLIILADKDASIFASLARSINEMSNKSRTIPAIMVIDPVNDWPRGRITLIESSGHLVQCEKWQFLIESELVQADD